MEKYSIVPGREELVEVDRSELVSDYNQCGSCQTNGYGFLRVLSAKEKKRFIERMEPDTLLFCYKTRSIKTLDWIRILKNISLETEYHIYRKSYWGENGGSIKVSTFKTPSMVLVCVISGVKYNNPYNVKKIRLNLLLENNRITIIEKINPAFWKNDKYQLDSTEDLIM